MKYLSDFTFTFDRFLVWKMAKIKSEKAKYFREIKQKYNFLETHTSIHELFNKLLKIEYQSMTRFLPT